MRRTLLLQMEHPPLENVPLWRTLRGLDFVLYGTRRSTTDASKILMQKAVIELTTEKNKKEVLSSGLRNKSVKEVSITDADRPHQNFGETGGS